MKRSIQLALVVGLGAALLSGPAAFAQYPPPCTVLEVDAAVKAGDTEASLHVCGIRTGSFVTLALEGTGVTMTVPVNAVNMALSMPLPKDLAPGVYTITASGIDEAGKTVRFEVPFTVLAPGSPAAIALDKSVAGGSKVASFDGLAAQVKGVQLSRQQGSGALVAANRTPAALRFAGLGLLALLSLPILGAIGYMAVARIRR